MEKIEQVVRLIRSKGVGVYFVTQNPLDIPETVLGQLGNRVQHALRAFTPRDQKAVKTAATTLRANPALDVERAITELAVGEALVSFLDAKGTPAIVERAWILPPASRIGPLTPAERQAVISASVVKGHYEQAVDRESAYEKIRARADANRPTTVAPRRMSARRRWQPAPTGLAIAADGRTSFSDRPGRAAAGERAWSRRRRRVPRGPWAQAWGGRSCGACSGPCLGSAEGTQNFEARSQKGRFARTELQAHTGVKAEIGKLRRMAMRALIRGTCAGVLLLGLCAAPAAAQTPAPTEPSLLARLASQPTDVEATLDSAKLYIAQGRLDEAVRMTQRAMSLIQQRQSRMLLGGNAVTPVRVGQPPAPPAGSPGSCHAGPRRFRHQGAAEIRDVRPVYPEIALASRVQGLIIVEAVIGTDGTVKDARVLRGQALLDQAARRCRPSMAVHADAPERRAGGGHDDRAQLRSPVSGRWYYAAGGQPAPWDPLDPMIARAVRVGGDIKEPKKIHDVKPMYPPEAQGRRCRGSSSSKRSSTESGRCGRARVLRGEPELDGAAVGAVMQWKYTDAAQQRPRLRSS